VTVAVVSSCYGNIDEIAVPPFQSFAPNEWVMVTDESDVPDAWRTVRQPRAWAHPRFAAKHAKCRPFDYTDADVAIWLDSGARITSERFVLECLTALGDGDIACWSHPQRTRMRDEADLCMGIPKYAGMAMTQQVDSYNVLDDVLYATGCIVWRRSALADRVGSGWIAEQLRWGVQDQVSFPYVLRKFGVTPKPLPGGLYTSGLVQWTAH
jgi:hypothetical protein